MAGERTEEATQHRREQARKDLGDAYQAGPVDALIKKMVTELGRLGRKIEQDAGAPSLIVTVAGAGYKFAPPVSPATDEVCFGPPFSGLV